MNPLSRSLFLLVLVVLLIVGALVYFSPSEKVPPQESGAKTYRSEAYGFSVSYKENYAVDEGYQYELGPEKIPGVSFRPPESVSRGTNLGSDTYVSVETLPGAETCTADLFLVNGEARTERDENVTYSTAEARGAAVGNLYEEKVYAHPESDPCIAVRYFIHSSNIGNYEPGAVREFDRPSLLADFDALRRSLKPAETGQ